MRRLFPILAAGLLWAAPLNAADLENGEEVYEVCAGCHGPFAQGGGGGVYPRLAGMREKYLVKQMRLFKSRKRENIPMLPYATERELPEEDVKDVAAYIASIELATQLPPLEKRVDGLERLLQAKKVLNIPRSPGDIVRGKALYDVDCGDCHGMLGEGTKKGPLMTGQHTKYLAIQIAKFLDKTRRHRAADEYFANRPNQDMVDILAYLSTLDDSYVE